MKADQLSQLSFPMIWIIFLCICSPAMARMGQLRSYALDQTPTAELREGAQKEKTDDILELGYRNDTASVPWLRHLAETLSPSTDEINKITHKPKRPKNPSQGYLRAEKANYEVLDAIVRERRTASSIAAKMALTRMGVHSYFEEFAAGLSTTSYAWKTTCIEALGYMNDKRAVKYLGPLLYQDSPIVAPPGWPEDVALFPYSITAGIALGNLLPEEEDAELKNLKRDNPANRQKLLLQGQWRQWWERNKERYGK